MLVWSIVSTNRDEKFSAASLLLLLASGVATNTRSSVSLRLSEKLVLQQTTTPGQLRVMEEFDTTELKALETMLSTCEGSNANHTVLEHHPDGVFQFLRGVVQCCSLLGEGTRLHFGGEVIVKITSVTEKVQGSIRLVNQTTAEDLDPLHLKSNNPLLHDDTGLLTKIQNLNEQLVKAQVRNNPLQEKHALEQQKSAAQK